MQRCMRRVHACLAVTCHLHFWQNDRDLLGATAVSRPRSQAVGETEVILTLHCLAESACIHMGSGVSHLHVPLIAGGRVPKLAHGAQVLKRKFDRLERELTSCVKVEVAVLGSPSPKKPHGFCGRKAALNRESSGTGTWVRLAACLAIEQFVR